MASNEMLQAITSDEPRNNVCNIGEVNNSYENIDNDTVSAKNQKIFIGKSEESGNDGRCPIQLRRSVSELQRPKSQQTNTPNDSPITLRRQPGRYASNSGNPAPVLKTVSSQQNFGNLGRYVKPQKKGGKNMVLQLVLPVNGVNNYNGDPTNSPGSYIEIPGNGYYSGRSRYHSSSVYSLQESPHTEINPSVNNGNSSKIIGQRTSPTTPSIFGSVFGDITPTPPEEKKKMFRDLLSKTLSLVYALFIVAMGLSLYISDALVENRTTAEIFSVGLVLIALFYVLFLIVDIQFYKSRKEKFEKLVEEFQEKSFKVKENLDGQFQVDVVIPDFMEKSISHDYCFKRDKHSSNFFLKVGALAFCIGHLIHSGLIIGNHIYFFTSDDEGFFDCGSVHTLIMDLVYPMYSVFLLFFLFKYSNIIINKYVILARFGIMHCLSASICFWVWTITREIMEDITFKKVEKEKDNYDDSSENKRFVDYFQALKGGGFLNQIANISYMRFSQPCHYNDEQIRSVYVQISPYLFPFSVEFSILIVSIWYLMWQNIGICQAENEEEAVAETQCNNQPFEDSSDYTESNVVVHVDCHSSNRGLFGGIVVIVLTMVNCILFFVSVYMSNRLEQGLMVNAYTHLVLVSLMIISCVFGYRQITKLDVSTEHHNMIDEFLLFICIPAYLMNGIVSAAPALEYGKILDMVVIVSEVFQVLLQTMFIIDGIRRCSNSRILRKNKPGREIVTFLILVNISMWISQTFQVKSSDTKDYRYDFYGKELWTILGHVCLPLMMFYRFHSAVCFGDIWKFAYEPSRH